MKEYLAKPDETIDKHTENVLACLNQLLSIYGKNFTEKEKELFKIACQYHDYGKINLLFQRKIKQGKRTLEGEIPHGFFSSHFLDLEKLKKDFGEDYTRALVTAIYYHHDRGSKKKGECKEYFEKYVKGEALKIFNKNLEFKFEIYDKLLFDNTGSDGREISFNLWCKYALIKGMLNKCDYLASFGETKLELPTKYNEKYLSEKVYDVIKDTLKESQKYMLENQDKNVILVAPTGSGKTEAALLWGGDSKLFYTLPMQVASNQIYKRIYTDYDFKTAGLLHSDNIISMKEINNEDDDYLIKYFQTKFFSNPIIVCTVDQIFKFPFKSLGTEQLFATLQYSKVIIDEIQQYSATTLACLIYGLKMLSESNGRFAIVTATMSPLLLDFINLYVGEKNYKLKQITSGVKEIRHKIQIIENDFDYEHIMNSAQSKKVLIVCNTVGKCKEVYKNLKDINKKRVKGILHAKFIKKTKRKLESEIIEFSKSNEKGIWISTQIVEASLDIDFDELHTSMSAADSLLQRMGRCYRQRDYLSKKSNIFVYINNDGIGSNSVYDEEIYNISLNKLKKYDHSYINEIDKIEYINDVYNKEIIKKEAPKYYRELENKIKTFDDIKITEYKLSETEKLFRDINSILVIPEEIYISENLHELIENIKGIKKVKKENRNEKEYYDLYNKLLDYTISVNYNIYNPSKNKNIIEIIDFNIYRAFYKYNSYIGLTEEELKERFI